MSNYKIVKDDDTLLFDFDTDDTYFNLVGNGWEPLASWNANTQGTTFGTPAANNTVIAGANTIVFVQGPVGPAGPPGANGATGPAGANGSSNGSFSQGDFVTAVHTAFNNDTVLNWLGGNVTLNAPIVLEVTTTWKTGFGLRLNGAKIVCNFNDATKWAITVKMQQIGNNVVQNVGIRNMQITDGHFFGLNDFAGAIRYECLTNGSWIGLGLIDNITCDGHSDKAFAIVGSVFEGVLNNLTTTNGTGALWIERRGPTGSASDTDMGLPSAIYLQNPDFRDATGDAIVLSCPQQYTEPFDLTVKGGYIVSNGGRGIVAPAGITLVERVGFENNNGGCAMYLGYRGGVLKMATAANPIANANVNTPAGMAYLVDCYLANNNLVIEDCYIVDEGVGTGSKLARVQGAGTVFMNRSGTSADIDLNGPTIKTASYT